MFQIEFVQLCTTFFFLRKNFFFHANTNTVKRGFSISFSILYYAIFVPWQAKKIGDEEVMKFFFFFVRFSWICDVWIMKCEFVGLWKLVCGLMNLFIVIYLNRFRFWRFENFNGLFWGVGHLKKKNRGSLL